MDANNTNESRMTVYDNYTRLPVNLITVELEGIYGSALTRDMQEIIKLYEVYDKGAEFTLDKNTDYTPTDLKSKKAKKLIDEEARFMFSTPVDFNVKIQGKFIDVANEEELKQQISVIQDLIDNVVKKNNLGLKMLKAAKDCFIGKRVAVILNFNKDTGITIQFSPSLEFVYDVDPTTNALNKIVCFFTIYEAQDKMKQRIYKKKYWMQDGFCHVQEAIYDGMGNLIESRIEDETTLFTYIPAWVIVNDGLTGDLLGVSDIEIVEDFEKLYNKLFNTDIDANRQNMNPIKWARDMTPTSTKNLSIAPGAFWDLSSDVDNEKTGEVGILESSMNYTQALSNTMDRVENDMYDQLNIPNISVEKMQGIITSGKGLKAVYWPLITRSNEKMQTWIPALEFIANCIVDGAILYPETAKYYVAEKVPEIDFNVEVENNYALPEDEIEEKQMDMSEVMGHTMSIKSYMKKWRRLTDEEVDNELKQIVTERELLEDSYNIPDEGDLNIDLDEEGNKNEATTKEIQNDIRGN